MKVLIIEDEKPASQKLTRLLKEIDVDIDILDVLQSVEQSINWFMEHQKPDLVFMDIQLEDGTCFEIFEKCRIQTPIVFTTAYDEFALKAFKVNSVDYLLKPINLPELKNAIAKFNVHHAQNDYARFESIIKQLQPNTKERFLVKIGAHYKPIQTSNINCFYIQERCNFIQTDTGKNYPIDYSLDKIEQLIDSGMFFRVNRNFIIHLRAIEDIIAYSSSRLKIILKKSTEIDEIIVSRERVTDFKKWIDK